jgi:hypothetical protein
VAGLLCCRASAVADAAGILSVLTVPAFCAPVCRRHGVWAEGFRRDLSRDGRRPTPLMMVSELVSQLALAHQGRASVTRSSGAALSHGPKCPEGHGG